MTYITTEKLDSIAKYLQEKTGSIGVERHYDSGWCAQTFRVRTEKGPHVLKVSDRFIADNAIADMKSSFDDWKVFERLVIETKRGLLVTAGGVEAFELV